jgi:hypothetical protein
MQESRQAEIHGRMNFVRINLQGMKVLRIRSREPEGLEERKNDAE